MRCNLSFSSLLRLLSLAVSDLSPRLRVICLSALMCKGILSLDGHRLFSSGAILMGVWDLQGEEFDSADLTGSSRGRTGPPVVGFCLLA